MIAHRFLRVSIVMAALSAASTAHAQSGADYKWNVDVGIGWDNSISGNINSSAIGSLNDQSVVILKNRYEDVYGTGLHLRFGGGYTVNEVLEARLTFSFQSLDADLTRMGYVTGMAEVDDLVGTGLDTINDKSARWTMPFVFGVRAGF
jgi:hypothetical protein